MAFKDDMSISDVKFKLNDWFLDELGLDADMYTAKIDGASSERELAEIINGLYSHFKSKDPDTAKKLFKYWTELNK